MGQVHNLLWELKTSSSPGRQNRGCFVTIFNHVCIGFLLQHGVSRNGRVNLCVFCRD